MELAPPHWIRESTDRELLILHAQIARELAGRGWRIRNGWRPRRRRFWRPKPRPGRLLKTRPPHGL